MMVCFLLQLLPISPLTPLPDLFHLIAAIELGYLPTNTPFPRGEICFRGPNLFAGYFKNEQETNKARDEDGWFHTGDLGMFDAKGRLRLIDRKDYIIKLNSVSSLP